MMASPLETELSSSFFGTDSLLNITGDDIKKMEKKIECVSWKLGRIRKCY
jgi:hypothetical protein